MLNDGQMIVQDTGPRVLLSIEPHHPYSEELEGQLNYEERDDQLVGIAYEFSRSQEGSSVRLLTHDTTPLYMAKSVGLQADVIPDDWLLPPQTTEAEKELHELRAENARHKKAEPAFDIRFLDDSNKDVKRYEGVFLWFTPLSDSELEDLMRQIKNRFPLVEDYGSRESEERPAKRTGLHGLLGTRRIYTPATDEEIAHYRDKAYPGWLEECEAMLREHHQKLQEQSPIAEFTYMAANTGTRPATSALVTIEALGNFLVQPARPDEVGSSGDNEQEEQSEDGNGSELPRPPIAPSGQWRSMIGDHPHETARALDLFARSFRGLPELIRNQQSIFDIGYPLRSRDVNMLGWRTRHPIPKAGSTTRAP